jgi:hypothetical protein
MPSQLTLQGQVLIDHFRKLNREHQKNYLAKNRVLFNERRREAYAKKKGRPIQRRTPPTEAVLLENPAIFDEPILQVQEEPQLRRSSRTKKTTVPIVEIEEIPKNKRSKKKSNAPTEEGHIEQVKIIRKSDGHKYDGIDMSHLKTITYDQVMVGFNQLINLNFATESSIKNYRGHLKTAMEITKCNDLLYCLKNFHKIVKMMDESGYAKGSIKAYYQCLVYIIDHLNINITKELRDEYEDKFKASNVAYNAQRDEKQKTEKIPKFEDYEKKVLDTFGENSEMHLITLLYSETGGARDNFGLIIVKKRDDVDYTNNKNYLIVPTKTDEKLTVIINEFKTKNSYNNYDLDLSPSLSNKLREFIKDNNIKYGKYLFGKKKLSQTISNANKSMGYNVEGQSIGAVNLFRKMLASLGNFKALSYDEQVQIAKRFKHDHATHLKYLRDSL